MNETEKYTDNGFPPSGELKGADWFENWFDTEYYHLLYSHRNDEEAQQFISRLIAFLQLKEDCKILDVACGKGRHSRYFAQCGMDVTGIDLSENNIRYAQQFAHDKLHFTNWDMREPFAENTFDVVVNLFSSFGYFDDPNDDKRAINAMKTALKPNGYLVLDYMPAPEFIVRNLKAREILNRGDIQFHIQKKVEKGFIVKEINFIDKGEEHAYVERLKLIKPETFQKMFTEEKLTTVKVFGDYALNDFSIGSSVRQIWILKKEA